MELLEAKKIMDEKLGDIAYLGEAKLVPKADYPAIVPPVFSVDIITQQAQAAEPTETDEKAENFEKRQAQYARLAEKILALRETTIYDRKATPAGMRPVQYGDIAILTRSKAGYIGGELAHRWHSGASGSGRELFSNHGSLPDAGCFAGH